MLKPRHCALYVSRLPVGIRSSRLKPRPSQWIPRRLLTSARSYKQISARARPWIACAAAATVAIWSISPVSLLDDRHERPPPFNARSPGGFEKAALEHAQGMAASFTDFNLEPSHTFYSKLVTHDYDVPLRIVLSGLNIHPSDIAVTVMTWIVDEAPHSVTLYTKFPDPPDAADEATESWDWDMEFASLHYVLQGYLDAITANIKPGRPVLGHVVCADSLPISYTTLAIAVYEC